MFDTIGDKINQNTTDDEIKKLIFDDEVVLKEIERIIENIKEGGNKLSIFEDIKQQCKNKRLCDFVIGFISEIIEPYEDVKFLRELDLENFKLKIDYLFNNTVLKYELEDVVKEYASIDDEELRCSVKLLNTITDWVIVRRFTTSRFEHELYDLFRFDAEKCKYLFDLYTKNAQDLINIAVLDNIAVCKKMKNGIVKLLEIFKNVFDDDEDDEE